jgi:hypothetical protein
VHCVCRFRLEEAARLLRFLQQTQFSQCSTLLAILFGMTPNMGSGDTASKAWAPFGSLSVPQRQ